MDEARVLLVANQKGGTGKSMIACNLAGMFASDQVRVVLLDADPQGTASHFLRSRPTDAPQVLSARVGRDTPVAMADALTRAKRRNAELILIDSGKGISSGLRELVANTHYLLMPILPATPDMRSVETFYREVAISEDERRRRRDPLRRKIVLNGVRRNTTLYHQAVAYMVREGLPHYDENLRFLAAFPMAFGLGLTVEEMAPRSPAAIDMRALYLSLKMEVFQNASHHPEKKARKLEGERIRRSPR